MNSRYKVISLRAELKEDLRDKVLMTSEQLETFRNDFQGKEKELEKHFYSLPEATYTDDDGYHNYAYLIELRGATFIGHDNFNGRTVEIEVDWVSTDALAEFLDLEPFS